MKRFFLHTTVLMSLLTIFLIGSAQAADTDMIRVGLFYGDAALSSAHLENAEGSGYRFGYSNENGSFTELGTTAETQIAMLKTQNQYLANDLYTTNAGSGTVIGCYHIQLPEKYTTFQQAKTAADQITDAFPAWISGSYYVRVGAYPTSDLATTALSGSASVVGTSGNGVSVVKTKTTKILFQFDGTTDQIFTVKPVGDKPKTWFKGYRYYGDFLYKRIDGGNLTVINYVSLENYVKGVLPYEMSASWPLEALKAQAVCARNYARLVGTKHAKDGFDICNTIHCQVYCGLNKASDNSDRAVNETAGISAWYKGKLAQTYYYSSNGGASENVNNVWNSSANLPYLCGVVDPYEATIESTIPNYRWTVNFTAAELTTLLRDKGYPCGNIVALSVSNFTPLGNVATITFTDDAGKNYSFAKEKARTILGLRSMRFQIASKGGGTGSGYSVDEGKKSLPNLDGVWTIDGTSKKNKNIPTTPYAITSSGTAPLTPSTGADTASTFVVSGSGYGHQIGMSQWGAYAMAKQGFGYADILKFYYAGIELY